MSYLTATARYTLRSSQRGKDLAIEVLFFGRFAPDGRMRQAHMATRTVPVDGSGVWEGATS
ncbi:hypothetical protein GCM10010289_44500 [Streptomyces violascens]|uniref:Uncharacterized protein n=1 Tax=Streptomyces violascens TaxID=67381 RepID=A0ABQ3QXN9_9ACTN|nr:hypothetical protein GCM10010289_44500 [Streptomyces violascens]GHI42042.1 hypothetical protein Sviol_64500 [Streptomyces violascens]